MTPAIDVRNAFRIFSSPAGGTAALQGLTLAVEPGEVVVALGPSGSRQDDAASRRGRPRAAERGYCPRARHGFGPAGQPRARGRVPRLATRPPRPALRTRALTRPDLPGDRRALQLRLLGRDAASSRRAADELLERVGLRAHGAARPAELSGGEQQRVAVCAALAHRPQLQLADEPAGELDLATASAVYRLLDEARARTWRLLEALIVSHDSRCRCGSGPAEVWIRDGRVVEEARAGAAAAGSSSRAAGSACRARRWRRAQ